MKLKLSGFLSDGAVLQKDERIPVRGMGTPGKRVRAVLKKSAAMTLRAGFHSGENVNSGEAVTEGETVASGETVVPGDGRFCLELDPLPAGGPYELCVTEEENSVTVSDLLIGAVWYVSGQSNIDVDMERCRDSYPEIVESCQDDGLRTFRITEHADYHGPLDEPLTGEWKKAGPESIPGFSATGYFFARALREMTGIPVGFIQASLGGSRITSWLSREMLEGNEDYRPLLEEAERYADDAFLAEVIRQNDEGPRAWKESLSAADEGRRNAWEKHPEEIRRNGTRVLLPCFFRDTELSGFIGSVWLTREFVLPPEMAGKSAGLWLGTMVDSDEVYINGVKVGETAYQYPPRKYRVPERLLRAGSNTITIRLVVENGEGRFTPGKGYFLFNDQGVSDLKGTWFYRKGAACGPIPPTDFVNWKATGLFNGTAAPCFQVPVEGMVWYQGEANTHQPYDYLDLMKRYVDGYRKLWGKERLPFYYVQLPNYDVDLNQDVQWPDLREKQRRALEEIPYSGMAVTMDLGEDNDLHPHGKMEIGRRLALLAAHDLYGNEAECTGPVPVRAEVTDEGVRISLAHAEGLYVASLEKGSVLRDAELVAEDGSVYQARVSVEVSASDGKGKAGSGKNGENEVCLIFSCSSLKGKPAEVRYAYHNVMHGAMIYNGAGLPMSPFAMRVCQTGKDQ